MFDMILVNIVCIYFGNDIIKKVYILYYNKNFL